MCFFLFEFPDIPPKPTKVTHAPVGERSTGADEGTGSGGRADWVLVPSYHLLKRGTRELTKLLFSLVSLSVTRGYRLLHMIIVEG